MKAYLSLENLNKKQFILFLSCLIFLSCNQKDGIFFNNSQQLLQTEILTFGGSLNDSFKSIVKTANGYAALGFTQSNDFDVTFKSNISYDFWIVNFNQNHSVIWSKNFGGSLDDRGTDFVATKDGGFVVTGYSTSADGDVAQNFGNRDFWVFKIDAAGNMQWQQNFGFSGAETPNTIIQTNDAGFLVVGTLDVTSSGGQGNSKSAQKHAGGDYWAIKLNANGVKEWSRYFGGTFTDEPFDVIQTAENDFIMVGSSDSNDVDITNNKGSYDFWVIKIAATGNLMWQKNFGGTEIDEAFGITSTNNGNFLIVGATRSDNKDVTLNNGAADAWLIKIDANGTLIWQKTIGEVDFETASKIKKTNDNSFIIVGNSRSNINNQHKGQNDAWIFKVDENTNIKWQTLVGGTEIDVLNDVIQFTDNQYIAVGESNSADGEIKINKGFSDALLIKISE